MNHRFNNGCVPRLLSILLATTALYGLLCSSALAASQATCPNKILGRNSIEGVLSFHEEYHVCYAKLRMANGQTASINMNCGDRGRFASFVGKNVSIAYRLQQYWNEHDGYCAREDTLEQITLLQQAPKVPDVSLGEYSLYLWHSNTLWANQGYCLFQFTLDGQGLFNAEPPGVTDLALEILLLDENQRPFGEPVVIQRKGPIGDSSATRYDLFTLEVDCSAAAFKVNRAAGNFMGARRNLIKTRQLEVRKFEPMAITIGNK